MSAATKAKARAAILSAWASYKVDNAALPATQAARSFVGSFTAREVGCEPWVYEAYPGLSLTTLYQWRRQLKTAPLLVAEPKPRNRLSAFDAEPLRGALLALRSRHPRVSVVTLHALLCQVLPNEAMPTVRALAHHLQRERERHPQHELLLRNPDAWRSAFVSAAGSYSAEANRPNALWETDTTLGDVALRHVDGVARHSIVGLIDVFSRRALFLVTRHSRTSAVLSLLRRAMSVWGMPAAIKTDRGAEFTSQHFKLAMLSLGIEHRPCDPFSPNQKPHIERVFGTLTRQLFELLPGYVGHSVAERKEIEARRSFAQRMRSPEPPTLHMTAGELQRAIDQWVQRYEARAHESLRRKSPAQAFAEGGPVKAAGARTLDALLLPVSNEGERTVGKKGVQVDGRVFNHAELGGREGTRVLCFMDEADEASLYIYEPGGVFVCHAVDLDAEPSAAPQVAAQRRRRQLQLVSDFKAEVKEASQRFDADAIVRDFHGLEAPKATVVPLAPARRKPEASQPDQRAVQRAQSVLSDLFPELLPSTKGGV